MVFCARFFGKRYVAFYLFPLAFAANALVVMRFCIGSFMDIAAKKERIVLTMSGDNFAEPFCRKHCLFHNFRTLHALAVIRKCNYLARHIVHVGQDFAIFVFCYRAVWQNIDYGVSFYYIKLGFEVLQ